MSALVAALSLVAAVAAARAIIAVRAVIAAVAHHPDVDVERRGVAQRVVVVGVLVAPYT